MRRFLPYKTALGERASKLRQNMTQPEQKLWRGFLQNHEPRFRRQRMIKTFIVDFYCPAAKLVIEVDGESHFTEEGKTRDAERTAVLEGLGLYVLRFTNREVMQEFEGVCTKVSEIVAGRANVGPPPAQRIRSSYAHPVRGEDNRDSLNAKNDSDGSLTIKKVIAENFTTKVEDKNPLPVREGQGRVKPRQSTKPRES